jgi:hypothetical protein
MGSAGRAIQRRFLSPKEEVRGTLRSAARSYDEKKVPFIGAFYASFVFEEDVNVNTGQFLLNLLDVGAELRGLPPG